MVGCAVANCNNSQRTQKVDPGLSFHKFPCDKQLKSSWATACNRQDKFNTKNAVICSAHFADDDFIIDKINRMFNLKERRMLKKTSIPTQNLPTQETFVSDRIERMKRMKLRSNHGTIERNESKYLEMDANLSFSVSDLHDIETKFEGISNTLENSEFDQLEAKVEEHDPLADDLPPASPVCIIAHPVSNTRKKNKRKVKYDIERVEKAPTCSEIQHCLLCGDKSVEVIPNWSPNHSNVYYPVLLKWQISRARSLCKLLGLDPMTSQSLFVNGSYCANCFQLLLNIDFTWNKICDLESILQRDKASVLGLISTYYHQQALGDQLEDQSANLTSFLQVANELRNKSTSHEAKTFQKDPKPDAAEFNYISDDPDSDWNGPPKQKSRTSVESKDPLDLERTEDVQESFCEDNLDFEESNCSDQVEVVFPRRTNFTCSQCPGVSYKRRSSLRQHTSKIHLNVPLLPHKCPAEGCTERFSKLVEIEQHFQTEHPNSHKPACHQCGNTYFSQFQVKRHIKRAHTKKNLKCSHCDKIFNTKNKLFAHEESHKTSLDYLCSDCGKCLKTQKHFYEHKSIRCPNRTETLTPSVIKRCENRAKLILPHPEHPVKPCKFCYIKFPLSSSEAESSELTSHEALHISGAPVISCVLKPCETSGPFSNIDGLRSHVQEVHEPDPSPPGIRVVLKNSTQTISYGKATCTICKKNYSSRDSLYQHTRRFHAEQHKDGPKTSSNKHAVKRSWRPLNFYKKFCSKECGLSFDTHEDLRRHRIASNHISQPRVKTFVCNLCGIGYTLPHRLREHKMLAHTDNPQPKFQCKICGKKFFKKILLYAHEQIHDDRIFPCTKCGKGFGTIKNLKQHESAHCPYGERPENANSGRQITKPKMRRKTIQTDQQN